MRRSQNEGSPRQVEGKKGEEPASSRSCVRRGQLYGRRTFTRPQGVKGNRTPVIAEGTN